MADEKKRAPQEEGDKTVQEVEPNDKDFLSRFRTRKFLAILLGISLGANVIGISITRYWPKAEADEFAAEISLGDYEFVDQSSPSGSPSGGISRATFSLYVALLDPIDERTRQRLPHRTYRIQQNVETLLRQAHSEDFEDPSLAELKLRLQEEINRTLEIRAIGEVIVTDLSTDRTALD